LCADTAAAGTLAEQAEDLVRHMDPPQALVAGFTQDVLALRAALLGEGSGPSFEQVLTRMAFAWLGQQSDISPLQNLLVGLQRRWFGTMEPARFAAVAERLQLGQVLLSNAVELFHNRERVAQNHDTWDLRRELKKRLTAVDIDALLGVLSAALLRLGVRTCLLALYQRPTTLVKVQQEGLPRTSRLVLALDDGQVRQDVLREEFPTLQLLPAALLATASPRRRVLLPMFYLQEHFGYMVLERQEKERFSYEDLHHEIGTALHSCLVVKELAAARDALRLDLDRARRDNEALSHLAMRDELTGLFNRRGFFELARSMLSTARLTRQPLTLIFADLDGLKQINDEHGHEEGDEAIREAACLLQQTFRQDDIVSRIGGDEFVVLSRADNLENLPDIERRLDRRFDAFNQSSGKPYQLGCSLGGTVIPADSVEPLDNVLAQADRLLYAAKRRRKAQTWKGL
jgi:diguanylate cyclase (GGDEF)-like protein